MLAVTRTSCPGSGLTALVQVAKDRLMYEASIRGWDQRRLAREAGLSEATVCRVMAGHPIRGLTALYIVQALRRTQPIPELVELIEAAG